MDNVAALQSKLYPWLITSPILQILFIGLRQYSQFCDVGAIVYCSPSRSSRKPNNERGLDTQHTSCFAFRGPLQSCTLIETYPSISGPKLPRILSSILNKLFRNITRFLFLRKNTFCAKLLYLIRCHVKHVFPHLAISGRDTSISAIA